MVLALLSGIAAAAVVVSSAADPSIGIAPGGLAAVSGVNLALAGARLPVAGGPRGVSVVVTDSMGVRRTAAMTDVWSTGVEFEMPAGSAAGAATVDVVNPSGDVSANVVLQPLAPGLFVLNDLRVAAASAIRIQLPTLQQSPVPVFRCTDTPGSCRTAPIDLGVDTPVILSLYGTGLRGRSAAGTVVVHFGTLAEAHASYAGPQLLKPGLDQINVGLPLSLRGAGELDVWIEVDGIKSNEVRIAIQ